MSVVNPAAGNPMWLQLMMAPCMTNHSDLIPELALVSVMMHEG
jgi:hypothetical protein